MTIALEKADISDAREIYDLQIESFKELLNKYQDFDYSPGAEKPERTDGANHGFLFYFFGWKAYWRIKSM